MYRQFVGDGDGSVHPTLLNKVSERMLNLRAHTIAKVGIREPEVKYLNSKPIINLTLCQYHFFKEIRLCMNVITACGVLLQCVVGWSYVWLVMIFIQKPQ